jgi:integrase
MAMGDRLKPNTTYRPNEVAALVKALRWLRPSGKGFIGIRNRALLVLLWWTELRISEILDLRMSDLDLEAGSINVQSGKGGKQGIVLLDYLNVAGYLERWWDYRKTLNPKATAPMFCTYRGKRIEERYVRGLICHVAKMAGIARLDLRPDIVAVLWQLHRAMIDEDLIPKDASIKEMMQTALAGFKTNSEDEIDAIEDDEPESELLVLMHLSGRCIRPVPAARW